MASKDNVFGILSSGRTLAEIEVATACTKHASMETILEYGARLKGAIEALKRVYDLWEASRAAWIETHGDITQGTKRWYLGTDKTTKCTDPKGLLEHLLGVADLETIGLLLAADPWKYGAVKQFLDDDAVFARFFDEKTDDVVKEGKAKKVVKEMDTRYVKKKQHAKNVKDPARNAELQGPSGGEAPPIP